MFSFLNCKVDKITENAEDCKNLISTIDWVMFPYRHPHPKPWTCKYVTLHDKKDFVGMIKLRTLQWGGNLGLFGHAQCNYKCSCETGTERSESEVGDVMTEQEAGMMQRRSHEPRAASGLQNLKKA